MIVTKIYVERQDTLITRMFEEHGYEITEDVFECDVLVLEGGADVTPELYGEENTHSHNNKQKDLHTLGLLGVAKILDTQVVGICRGHQILAVWHGGSLNQHIEGHNNTEHTVIHEGVERSVVGDHHQSVKTPEDFGLFSAQSYTSPDGVCEVLVHHNGDLGFQGHPEWVDRDHDTRKFFFELFDKHVLPRVKE